MAKGDAMPARIAARQLRDRNLGEVTLRVAISFGIPSAWILSEERYQPTVRARFAALYIGREIWGYSITDLSEFFNRDRQSVYHGLARAARLYKRNPTFRKLTDDAVQKIWPSLPTEEPICTAV